MNRKEATEEVKRRALDILAGMTQGRAKRDVNGRPTYICTLCGHGAHGDGIAINPKSKSGTGLKCFGCGFSGSIIDYAARIYETDYETALTMCCDYLGLTIDEKRPDSAKKADFGADKREHGEKPDEMEKKAEKPLFDENRPKKAANPDRTEDPGRERAALSLPADNQTGREDPAPLADYSAFYRESAARLLDPADPAGLLYLQGRGISAETARRYSVGYAPEWISPTAKRNLQEKGSRWTPPTSRRLIIPVSPSHYIARAIDDEKTEKQFRKMNETGGGSIDIFNRAALYSGAAAVFIFEGAIDALSAIEAGAAAVGLNSTSNIDALLQALKEKPPTVGAFIISLDNDDAGQKAAGKLAAGLEKLGLQHIAANVSGAHKDANEALQADRREFVHMIDEAQAAADAEKTRDILDFSRKIQTDAYRPYSTYLPFVDDLIDGGMTRQTLLFLLAAPGAGKTTLAQQMAEEMAAHGKPVLYLNFEMSREQMLAKAISYRLAKKGHIVAAGKILKGYLWTDDERARILSEIEDYRKTARPFIQYNPDGVTADLDALLEYLQAVGEKAAAEGKEAPAVIVDYIHLISTAKGLDAQEIIKQAAAGLKRYALKYNTFVVAISAINRASSNGGITLQSGRDSSALEYSGDYQISLNYEDVDSGKVSTADLEKYAELQRETPRRVILRQLKTRLFTTGLSKKVYFDAEANIFYGRDDFIPAGLARKTPFDDPDDTAGKEDAAAALKSRPVSASF